MSLKLLTLFCVVFLWPGSSAEAKTLREYRENIAHLKGDIYELLYPGEEQTPEDREYLEQQFLAETNKFFPPKEKIEFEGTAIETDNRWFSEKIDEYKNAPQNAPKRAEILNAIYERLEAIESKIDELEKAAHAGRTKDEDKQKLAEILKREEYQRPPEQQEESYLQRKWREFVEWLESLFPRPTAPQGQTSGGSPNLTFILQIVLFAVIFGLVGFLVYKFAPFLAGKFGRREKREKKERVILGEKLRSDETPENLFAEAEKLAREGNLRQAIRKGYVALLCELSDRKIIGLARHKTNRDYLRDVRGKGELYENMNGLTQNFERHWYGFDSVEQKDWEEFRQGYGRAVGSSSSKSGVMSLKS